MLNETKLAILQTLQEYKDIQTFSEHSSNKTKMLFCQVNKTMPLELVNKHI